MQREPGEVGDNHHALAREAVGPDATDQEETNERQRLGGEHKAEICRTSGAVDHEQRHRNGDDAIAEDARRLREPQPAEVAVPEHPHELTKVCHRGQNDAKRRSSAPRVVRCQALQKPWHTGERLLVR